jgi:hypothetical protein
MALRKKSYVLCICYLYKYLKPEYKISADAGLGTGTVPQKLLFSAELFSIENYVGTGTGYAALPDPLSLLVGIH